MRYLSLTFLLFVSFVCQSQGFEGKILLGLNAAQFDGDDLANFKKLGQTGGAMVTFNFNARLQSSVEFLYSQRGARNGFTYTEVNNVNIDIKYVEIPFVMSYKSRYDKIKRYYKVRADAGFSFARVLNKSTIHNIGIPLTNALQVDADNLNTPIQNIKDLDYSIILGAGFQATNDIEIGVRYTRSLTKMYESDKNLTIGLLDYFLT